MEFGGQRGVLKNSKVFTKGGGKEREEMGKLNYFKDSVSFRWGKIVNASWSGNNRFQCLIMTIIPLLDNNYTRNRKENYH